MSLAVVLLALSPLWVGLESGPYSVGFETMPLGDYSRPFRAEGDDATRALTVSIWYPARSPRDQEPIPFGHYFDSRSPGDPGTTGRGVLSQRLRAMGHDLDEGQLSRIAATPTAAFERLERSNGSFPLVLFGSGLTAPSYVQSVLCEYLASYGYVVIAIPSLQYREDVPAGYDAITVDTLVRDIEFVIHEMREYPGVDVEKLGLVASSVSGVAHALVQMKNPDVDAVVSLDAGTGYSYGLELLRESLYFDPTRAIAPLYHATDSRDDTSPAAKSFEYYDHIHRGPAFFLTLPGASHAEFTSLASVVAPDGDPEPRRRYRLLCIYVRQFLDLAIKADASAEEFLDVTPSRHGFEGLTLSKR